MNDDIMYLHLCGRLMTGRSIEETCADSVEADNMLYGAFGMSAEEIREKLCGNVDNAAIFY